MISLSNSIKKSDYYYGSFLSKVIEHGNKLAIIGTDRSRGIYKLTTNKAEYITYIKYCTRDKNQKTWSYSFYKNTEINEIKGYINNHENIIFIFICSYKDLNNGEIAIIYKDEFLNCINLNNDKLDSQRLIVKKVPNSQKHKALQGK